MDFVSPDLVYNYHVDKDQLNTSILIFLKFIGELYAWEKNIELF